jgi:putative phosphoesterase
MSVAALYDIHGNLPALEAVLAEIAASGVERIVVGGDVLPGPMPAETLDRLESLPVRIDYIRGNGENDALTARAGEPLNRVPAPYHDIIRWNASQLSDAQVRRIQAWPATCRTTLLTGERVLFCHATPRSDNAIFTRQTAEALLTDVFDEANADVVVCGHTHMQFDRMIGRTQVVNAGSVGMPFGAPGAYWLLLADRIELRRTTYALDSASKAILGTAYPRAEEFVSNSLVNPPSEESMLAAFGRAELRP